MMASSGTLSEIQPLRSSTTTESNEEPKSNKSNPSFRVSGGKRLIWREIYAEVKETSKWYNCCSDGGSDPRVVLNQISGVAEPGQLTFLMGSSGAGKTTLLNILTQRARGLRIYGEVRVNSHVLKPGEMRKMSAYVPQEDIFMGALTVRETLMLAARLRMSMKLTAQQRMDRVMTVACEMGLEPAMNTKIGCRYEKSISLGEKKRLSFACEILTDPAILFCDEPTSGLDSFMAVQVMKALANLTHARKTVICSIHQPSSQVFQMANWLVLIARGQVAYQGPIDEVATFFSNCGMPCPQYVSVPDHFMKMISGGNSSEESAMACKKRTNTIFKAYETSEYASHVNTETSRYDRSSVRARMRMQVSKGREYAAHWHIQYVWLLWRGVLIVLRNPMIIRLRLFQCIMVALISGMVYLKTTITADMIITGRGLAFEIVRSMNILFLMPSIHILTSELPTVYRDYQAGMYSPSAYFFGKMTADGIQYVLLPLLHSTIVYWMAGLKYNVQQYLWILLVSIMEAFVATSVGYAGACIFGELSMAALVVPMFSIPMLIFGGLFIDFDSIPVYFRPFTYLSWYRYGYETSLAAIFKEEGEIPGCLNNGTLNRVCTQATGLELLRSWRVDPDLIWVNVIAMFLFVVGWRTVALLALTLRCRHA